MSKIIDARSVGLKQQRVLFDTNVWILINGLGANSSPQRTAIYSQAYKTLLDSKNTVVINDYVVGEFLNKCTKFEYNVKLKEFEKWGQAAPRFKDFRRSKDFAPVLQQLRDLCREMVSSCEFIATSGVHYDIDAVIATFCDDCADFSDIVLIEFCKHEKLFLMTDDKDFAGWGVDIITGNRRIN